MAKLCRLQLDYDIPREEAVEDADRLTDEYEELADGYRVEPSKTDDRVHIIWVKSTLPWKQALAIAGESRCDPDWLDLAQQFGGFGLVTEDAKLFPRPGAGLAGYAARIGMPTDQQTIESSTAANTEVNEVTSETMIILKPLRLLDVKRLQGLCKSMGHDDTWQWRTVTAVTNKGPRKHIHIGCMNRAQAERRIQWLRDKLGKGDDPIKFKAKIVKRKGKGKEETEN